MAATTGLGPDLDGVEKAGRGQGLLKDLLAGLDLLQLGDVCAGNEIFPVPGDHDGLDLVILEGLAEWLRPKSRHKCGADSWLTGGLLRVNTATPSFSLHLDGLVIGFHVSRSEAPFALEVQFRMR